MVPTSGAIRIQDQPVIPGSSDLTRKVGFMPDQGGIYARLSVRQHLTFFQRLYQVEKSRVDEVIRLSGLLDRQDEPMKKLSGNLAARVRLAQTVLHSPPVLLLDEPTSRLDLETTEIMRRMIVQAAESGSAVLVTTSSYEEAQSLAHRIGRLHNGRIESWEKPEEASAAAPDSSSAPIPQAFKIEKIPARVHDKIILFNPLELVYIESQEGSCVLHTPGEEFNCPLTLTELEGRLKPFGFFRSHRSYIVNLQHVREVIPWTRNSYSLVLDDPAKTTIPLSRNSARELEGIFGL